MKVLDIYTDAAGSTKDFGIGILFIDDEYETKFQYKITQKYANKRYDEQGFQTNVQIGEAFAILFAIENIYKKYDKINIYTDNYSVFGNLNNLFKIKRPEKRRRLYAKLINEINEKSKDLNININWIKAHCGVYGNEIVDKLAKKALKNNVPIYDNLQTFEYNYFKN